MIDPKVKVTQDYTQLVSVQVLLLLISLYLHSYQFLLNHHYYFFQFLIRSLLIFLPILFSIIRVSQCFFLPLFVVIIKIPSDSSVHFSFLMLFTNYLNLSHFLLLLMLVNLFLSSIIHPCRLITTSHLHLSQLNQMLIEAHQVEQLYSIHLESLLIVDLSALEVALPIILQNSCYYNNFSLIQFLNKD